MGEISIALSKGRIFDETAPLLARVGVTPKGNGESSRKLILETNRADVRLIVVRATDTPTYVQHGGADLGIAGRDVLVEHDDGLPNSCPCIRHSELNCLSSELYE